MPVTIQFPSAVAFQYSHHKQPTSPSCFIVLRDLPSACLEFGLFSFNFSLAILCPYSFQIILITRFTFLSWFCAFSKMTLSCVELTPQSCFEIHSSAAICSAQASIDTPYCFPLYSTAYFFIMLIFINGDVYCLFYPFKKEMKSAKSGILSLLAYFFLLFVKDLTYVLAVSQMP